MRFLIQIAIVMLLGFGLAQFFPWWSIAIAGAVAGYFVGGHRGKSFAAGFLGGLLLWTVAALVMTSYTGSDLPDRFAKLMNLPLGAIGLAIVSGLIGGLVAGIAAFTGDSIKRLTAK